MTNEEIKKGLESCVAYKDVGCNDCPYCPYDNQILCQNVLCKDARDLIIEQEKDIKQLKTECALLDDELRIARQETINVLNKLKEKIFHCLGVENIQQASGLSLLGSLVPYDIVIDNIDELIKEYVR